MSQSVIRHLEDGNYSIIQTLKQASSPRRKARICAVFGIIAFVDVPMVIISARFMPDIHRPSFSFTSSWQSAAFMLSMVATILLGSLMISFKADILRIKARLDEQTFS